MFDSYEALLRDLIARTEKAAAEVAGLAAHTGNGFRTEDVVDAVERGLPDDYPAPTTGPSRRDIIMRIAQDVLTGALHEDGDA